MRAEETVGHCGIGRTSGLACEGEIDVWEMFSDNSYLSAILDQQGLQVAAPIDLRTKKSESLSPQLIQGFWQKLKKKNPKIVVMSQTFETKSCRSEEVVWQQHHLCMDVAEHQILGGKHFFFFLGSESGKIWWLKKCNISRKGTIANGPFCVARNPGGFFTISAIFCVHWS